MDATTERENHGRTASSRRAEVAVATAVQPASSEQREGDGEGIGVEAAAERDGDARDDKRTGRDAGSATVTPQGVGEPNSDALEPEMPGAGSRPLDKISAVSNAVWLMTQSAPHKHLFVTDLEWLLMPPVAAGQFRLWRKDDKPLAFATWAFLSEEAEQRLIAGRGKLPPAAWNSGDAPWLMDLVAPFGGREEVLRDLKAAVFPERPLKSLRPGKDGAIEIAQI